MSCSTQRPPWKCSLPACSPAAEPKTSYRHTHTDNEESRKSLSAFPAGDLVMVEEGFGDNQRGVNSVNESVKGQRSGGTKTTNCWKRSSFSTPRSPFCRKSKVQGTWRGGEAISLDLLCTWYEKCTYQQASSTRVDIKESLSTHRTERSQAV